MWKFENESLFQIFKFISINDQQFFYFFGRKPYRLGKYGESYERYTEKTVILGGLSIYRECCNFQKQLPEKSLIFCLTSFV